ncbi:MAG: hypothetical protein QM737_02890 [Ferruginibacter sp.]
MNDNIVYIESFNAYESRYPNRKIVTREVLNLIKTLREAGHTVIVKPEDDRPIEYLFKKGEISFLTDPANQVIISFVTSMAGTLITNWIQKLIDKNSNKEKANNSIIVIDNSTKIIKNSFNKTLSRSELADAKTKRKKVSKEYEESINAEPPYANLPWPILLNHKPPIIGWCRLAESNKGLEIEDGYIKKKYHAKIEKGNYKGVSITGIAAESKCSICKKDYVDCNHISGKKYDGVMCTHELVRNDIIEVSVVKEPINKGTFIRFLKDSSHS